MNNSFTLTTSLLFGSLLLISGCSEDNSSFETPNTSEVPINSGTLTQKNFSILADTSVLPIYDENGLATDTTMTITVKVGDRKNQMLTDKHTVYFATEWGLIDPSCVTEDGTCTVNWQTSFNVIDPNNPVPVPSDHTVTITAYTLGEEDFSDSNSDGIFDNDDQPFPNGSLFFDRSEPYVDANDNRIFDAGDTLIDVLNGNTLGQNKEHDLADGFLSSPNCRHDSLCSATLPRIYIWTDLRFNMDPPPTP